MPKKQIDIDKAINIAVKSGKVELGSRNAIRNAKLGKARLIILASNCPTQIAERIQFLLRHSQTRLLRLPKTSLELGSICGRPHRVASLTIHEPGDSKILDFIDQPH